MDEQSESANISMNELKPCPFCGGTAKLHRDYRFDFTGAQFYVSCNIGCVRQITPTADRSWAVERWNRRC